MAALELRPMAIGDILDTTFRLYKWRFLPFLTITLLAYVPFGLVMGVFQTSLGMVQQSPFEPAGFQARVLGADRELTRLPWAQIGPGGQFEPQPVMPSLGAVIAGSLGTILFVLIVLPLCQGALVHNISASYLGEDLSAASSYGRAAPRLVRMLVVQLLAGIAIMIGFILCVVPGIIFALWFSLIAPVVMLENLGVFDTLKRSRELLRGNLGKAFLLFLVVGLLGFAFNWVVALGSALIPWPHPFLPAFIGTVLPAVILPIQLAPTILLYYDIRIRKEAFDLQQLAGQLGQPGQSGVL
jgi:hypothetical protein